MHANLSSTAYWYVGLIWCMEERKGGWYDASCVAVTSPQISKTLKQWYFLSSFQPEPKPHTLKYQSKNEACDVNEGEGQGGKRMNRFHLCGCCACNGASRTVWHTFKGLDMTWLIYTLFKRPEKRNGCSHCRHLFLRHCLRAFIHLSLLNHWTTWTQTSVTADSPHTQSDPSWKIGFTMMRKWGSKKVLFCNNRVCDCRGRSY